MQPLKGVRDIADEQQTKGHIAGSGADGGSRVVLVLVLVLGLVQEVGCDLVEWGAP